MRVYNKYFSVAEDYFTNTGTTYYTLPIVVSNTGSNLPPSDNTIITIYYTEGALMGSTTWGELKAGTAAVQRRQGLRGTVPRTHPRGRGDGGKAEEPGRAGAESDRPARQDRAEGGGNRREVRAAGEQAPPGDRRRRRPGRGVNGVVQ